MSHAAKQRRHEGTPAVDEGGKVMAGTTTIARTSWLVSVAAQRWPATVSTEAVCGTLPMRPDRQHQQTTIAPAKNEHQYSKLSFLNLHQGLMSGCAMATRGNVMRCRCNGCTGRLGDHRRRQPTGRCGLRLNLSIGW